MRKLKIVLISGLFILLLTASAVAADIEEIKAKYEADYGIQIISYTDEWVELELIQVYDELMNNGHGLEIEYLDRIEIRPGSNPETEHNVMATYQNEKQQGHIGINLAGFLPEDFQVPVNIDKGVIRIYKGEEREAIEDIAVDLSHEYGHHFTLYHFGETFTMPESFKDSDYYNIRGLEDYDSVNAQTSHELEMHRWSIYELAAEDYRQILGSDTGRQITGFKDIEQKIGQEVYQPVNDVSILDYNAMPQLNWKLPTAFHNSELVDYFNSFVSTDDTEKISAPAMSHLAYELPGLEYSIKGIDEHYQTRLSWDTTDGPNDAVYTLVAYTEERVIPIKTVFPGEKSVAYIGTVYYEKDGFRYYYQDGLDTGELWLRLQMLLPDGRNLSGDMINIDFEQGLTDAVDSSEDTD